MGYSIMLLSMSIFQFYLDFWVCEEGGGSLYNDRAARSNRACAIRRNQSAVLISPDRAWSRIDRAKNARSMRDQARSMRDQARSMRDQCAINARSGAINARSMRDQCAINARSGAIRRDQARSKMRDQCAINARSMRDQCAVLNIMWLRLIAHARLDRAARLSTTLLIQYTT